MAWNSRDRRLSRVLVGTIGVVAGAFGACGTDNAGSGGGGSDGGGDPNDLRDGATLLDGGADDARTDAQAAPAPCAPGAWCWEYPRPTSGDIHAMWAASVNDLWAVDGNGAISHFDGSRWEVRYQGTDGLRAIYGFSATDIWAVGRNDTIVHFNGTSWIRVRGGQTDGGPAYDLAGIWGAAPNDIWAVTPSLDFLHYDGTTWSPGRTDGPPATCPTLADYRIKAAIWRGTAGGCGGTVAWLSNKVWSRHVDPGFSGQKVHAVWAPPSPERTYYGTTNGLYYGSEKISNITQVSAITGTSNSDVWVTTYDGHLYHGGGSSNWREVKTPEKSANTAGANLLSVWSGGGKTLVGGFGGRILQPVDSEKFDYQPGTRITNESLSLISVLGDSERWVSGDSVVFHYRAGGWSDVNRWADAGPVVQPGSVKRFDEIVPMGPNEAWGIVEPEQRRLLLRFKDGSWSPEPLDTGNAFLSRVSASGKNDVWVAGTNGFVAQYNGSTWKVHTSSVLPFFGSDTLHARAPNDVWVTGGDTNRNNVAVHYDGTSWKDASTTTDGAKLGSFSRIYAAAAGDVWATSGANLYHYTQGKWALVTMPHPPEAFEARFTFVTGTGTRDVWALLSSRAPFSSEPYVTHRTFLYHYDGARWTHEKTPPAYGVVSLAVSPSRVWLVGQDGMILARGK